MMELEDIKAYTARLENEYLELLSYRKGILKQIEEDEKALKESHDKTQEAIKNLNYGIRLANEDLDRIKKEREEYNAGFVDKELAVSVNLINVEEKERQLKRELDDFSRSKESYEIAMATIETEKVKLEKERMALEIEKELLEKMSEKEKKIVKDLEKRKKSLENSKIKEKKMLKGLKIKELKVAQRGEANKKTNEFLIRKAEALEREAIHINKQHQQLRNALKIIKKREAQINGNT